MGDRLMTRRASAAGIGRTESAPTVGDNATRVVTVAAVLLSAVIHLVLYFQGFSDIKVIGPLFLLNAIGGIVIGVVTLVWRHWLPVLGVIGFGALTLAAYLTSRTVGLLGVHETTWDVPSVLAMIGDIVALVGGVILLVRLRARRR